MKKNQLGKSDLWVSEIGFGCMSIGTDRQAGVKLIHEALDRGINFLDTADLYDQGKNEEIVGEAIKGRRDHVIVATKVGNRWRKDGEGWDWDPSKTYIKQAIKESLRRLATDYIDLYQLHGGTIEDPMDETIEAFEELKKEGLIRYYGISSIRPNVIREYVKRSNIVSVLTQYSILDRRPEEEILPLLEQNHIHVIARGPVAKGYLSQRGLAKTTKQGYQDYSKEELEVLLQRLESLTNDERSLVQLSLRYVLDHQVVATAIPGASRVEQLLENIKAGNSRPLSNEELTWIRNYSKQNVYQAHR